MKMKEKIKIFFNDNAIWIVIYIVPFTLLAIFTDWDELEKQAKNELLIKEYEQILEYEYDRTFESFEEYIVYRADKILGE